ncbi:MULTISPECIES: hypothetical protein [unclassified Peribacillus]|uniref:hypothetical protein n=1 Tax=unclassified Peribacillus TaxID=2675266 RepID=UPI00366DDB57
MTFNDNLNKLITEMSEAEAKNLLAKVFRKMGRVNGINYKATDCYSEIECIFRDEVVGKMMNFEKGDVK